jgi:hypothetical protein
VAVKKRLSRGHGLDGVPGNPTSDAPWADFESCLPLAAAQARVPNQDGV